MVRSVQPNTVSYKGHSLHVQQPGWYCEKCDEVILDGIDMGIIEDAFVRLRAEVDETSTQAELRPGPTGRPPDHAPTRGGRPEGRGPGEEPAEGEPGLERPDGSPVGAAQRCERRQTGDNRTQVPVTTDP